MPDRPHILHPPPLKTTGDGYWEEPVGPANQDYRTSRSGNWISVQYFDEARDFPGADWRYIDVAPRIPTH